MNLDSLSWGHVGHSVDWSHVGRIFSALLTPVIAAVVAYVAVQQWRTNRQQHRLALFDKRMAVFDGVRKFIATSLTQDTIELQNLYQLWEETQRHSFLFGPDVTAYITEVYEKGNELRATLYGIKAGEQSAINKNTELLSWFFEQRTAANDKFVKYMDFRKP